MELSLNILELLISVRECPDEDVLCPNFHSALEVHKGRDGLYYVIDPARLMPAEGPGKFAVVRLQLI
jgi:hypothetical protein